jgi:hypothetical protein
MSVRFFLLVALLVSFFASKGQDSIRIKKHEKIVYEDTTILVKKDTIIPFDKKIIKVKKRRLIRFYHNSLFVDTNEINALKRTKKTTSYKGKTVGNISFSKVKPFGTSIMDTSKHPENWFGRAGNKIHITTKDRIILNNLLFKEGDILTSHTLEESERILRTLLFILDARIYGVVRKSQPDIVDIYVVTKDVFSKSVKLNIGANNVLNIALEEINMFGLGQRFYNNIILSTERKVGFETQYTVYNLYGSYLRGDIKLAFTEDSLLLGISNERDFISPEIRNAGGFSYHYRELRYYARYDPELARTNVADNNVDAWYGRSFPIKLDTTRFEHLNFVSSARISSSWFTQRPLVNADTNLLFQNNTLLLTNVGISHSKFAKDIFVEGFGVTEDVPTGMLIDATAGGSIGEFVSRTYFGWRIAHGAL